MRCSFGTCESNEVRDWTSAGLARNCRFCRAGVPIEIGNPDPPEIGQCGKGIHVIPIEPPTDFTNVVFSDVLVLLEVAEEDVIFREGNGKMRVRKATPLRILTENDEEWQKIQNNSLRRFCLGEHIDYDQEKGILHFKYDDGTEK